MYLDPALQRMSICRFKSCNLSVLESGTDAVLLFPPAVLDDAKL